MMEGIVQAAEDIHAIGNDVRRLAESLEDGCQQIPDSADSQIPDSIQRSPLFEQIQSMAAEASSSVMDIMSALRCTCAPQNEGGRCAASSPAMGAMSLDPSTDKERDLVAAFDHIKHLTLEDLRVARERIVQVDGWMMSIMAAVVVDDAKREVYGTRSKPDNSPVQHEQRYRLPDGATMEFTVTNASTRLLQLEVLEFHGEVRIEEAEESLLKLELEGGKSETFELEIGDKVEQSGYAFCWGDLSSMQLVASKERTQEA